MTHLSALEQALPLTVESWFRNRGDVLFGPFIATACPRFENFRADSKVDTGKGLDVNQFVVHREYLALVEQKLGELLHSLGTSESTFVIAAEAALQDDNSKVVEELIAISNKYVDFGTFGEMMEDEFIRNFRKEKTLSSSTMVVESPSVASKESKVVRVLWDIENIPVNRHVGGMATVQKLTAFLKEHDLAGAGIDHRITAFFNPQKMNEKVLHELDAASVELVWVGLKQEDADRKLCLRISQEMTVLTPKETSFVLITSDKDFRTQIQLLSSAGFPVYIIHCANNPSWAGSLELHATAGYTWSSIMGPAPTGTQSSKESAEGSGKVKAGASVEETQRDELTENLRASLHEPVKVQLITGGYSYVEAADLYHTHKKGVCLRWKSSWGFICVAVPFRCNDKGSGVGSGGDDGLAKEATAGAGEVRDVQQQQQRQEEEEEGEEGEEEEEEEEEEVEGEGRQVIEDGKTRKSSTSQKGVMSTKNIDTVRERLKVRGCDGFRLSNGLTTLPSPPKSGPLGGEITDNTTNIVLVKVYVNSRALSFPGLARNYLDRNEVVRLLVAPASKGPRASVVDNEPVA